MFYLLPTLIASVVAVEQGVLLPARKVPFAAPHIKVNADQSTTQHPLVPASVLHDSLERLVHSKVSVIHPTQTARPIKIVAQKSTSSMSGFVWPTPKSTTSRSFLKRSTDLYSLRIPFRDEGYAELFLPNTTAAPFCESVSQSLYEDSTEVFVDLKIEFNDKFATVPIREDQAVSFCRDFRDREMGKSDEPTKTTLSVAATTQTRAGKDDTVQSATSKPGKGSMTSTPKATPAITTDVKPTPSALSQNAGNEGKLEKSTVAQSLPSVSLTGPSPGSTAKHSLDTVAAPAASTSEPSQSAISKHTPTEEPVSGPDSIDSLEADDDSPESSTLPSQEVDSSTMQALKSKVRSSALSMLPPKIQLSTASSRSTAFKASHSPVSREASNSPESTLEKSKDIAIKKLPTIARMPMLSSATAPPNVPDDVVRVAEIGHEQKFHGELTSNVSGNVTTLSNTPIITPSASPLDETMRVQEVGHQASVTATAYFTISSIYSWYDYSNRNMATASPTGAAVSARAWHNAAARPMILGTGLWRGGSLAALTQLIPRGDDDREVETENSPYVEEEVIVNTEQPVEEAPSSDETLEHSDTLGSSTDQEVPSSSRRLAKQRPLTNKLPSITSSQATTSKKKMQSSLGPDAEDSIQAAPSPSNKPKPHTSTDRKPLSKPKDDTDPSPTPSLDPETISYSFPSATAAQVPSSKLAASTVAPTSKRPARPRPTQGHSNITVANDATPGSSGLNSTFPSQSNTTTGSHSEMNTTNTALNHTTPEIEPAHLSTAFGPIEDHRMLWTVLLLWSLVGLQVLTSVWEFGKNAWGWKVRSYDKVLWKV